MSVGKAGGVSGQGRQQPKWPDSGTSPSSCLHSQQWPARMLLALCATASQCRWDGLRHCKDLQRSEARAWSFSSSSSNKGFKQCIGRLQQRLECSRGPGKWFVSLEKHPWTSSGVPGQTQLVAGYCGAWAMSGALPLSLFLFDCACRPLLLLLKHQCNHWVLCAHEDSISAPSQAMMPFRRLGLPVPRECTGCPCCAYSCSPYAHCTGLQ